MQPVRSDSLLFRFILLAWDVFLEVFRPVPCWELLVLHVLREHIKTNPLKDSVILACPGLIQTRRARLYAAFVRQDMQQHPSETLSALRV